MRVPVPLRAVPLGFWGVTFGAGLLAHALIEGPLALTLPAVALLALGAWHLRAWRRMRRARGCRA